MVLGKPGSPRSRWQGSMGQNGVAGPPGRRQNQAGRPERATSLFRGCCERRRYQRHKKTKALQAVFSLKGCTQFSWPLFLPCPPFAAGIRFMSSACQYGQPGVFVTKAGLLTPLPYRRPSHNSGLLQWHRGRQVSCPYCRQVRLQRRDRSRFTRDSLLSPAAPC